MLESVRWDETGRSMLKSEDFCFLIFLFLWVIIQLPLLNFDQEFPHYSHSDQNLVKFKFQKVLIYLNIQKSQSELQKMAQFNFADLSCSEKDESIEVRRASANVFGYLKKDTALPER